MKQLQRHKPTTNRHRTRRQKQLHGDKQLLQRHTKQLQRNKKLPQRDMKQPQIQRKRLPGHTKLQQRDNTDYIDTKQKQTIITLNGPVS